MTQSVIEGKITGQICYYAHLLRCVDVQLFHSYVLDYFYYMSCIYGLSGMSLGVM